MWKAFYVWRKQITFGKFIKVSNHMEQNLFISDPILSKALLEIKAMCTVFLNLSFYDASVTEKLTLSDFTEMQVNILLNRRIYILFKQVYLLMILIISSFGKWKNFETN